MSGTIEITEKSMPIGNALADMIADKPHLSPLFAKQIAKGFERYGVTLYTNILRDGQPLNPAEEAVEEVVDATCYFLAAWLQAEQRGDFQLGQLWRTLTLRMVKTLDEAYSAVGLVQ